MKTIKNMRLLWVAAVCAMAIGCSEDEQWTVPEEPNTPTPPATTDSTTVKPGYDFANDTISGNDMQLFDITFDYSALNEPTENIPAEGGTDEFWNDYLENSDFEREVIITYTEGAATVDTKRNREITYKVDGAHVIINSTEKKVDYIVSGASENSSLKIYSENKFKLTLDGVTLSNPTGAAINLQTKKRCYLVCTDGTTNTLTDGSTYDIPEGEDMKGCLFSDGKIIFTGNGLLQINAIGRNGISCDDYVRFRPGCNIAINATATGGHGVKTNDGIYLNGGILNIQVANHGKKGLSTESELLVAGGRTTIITTGNAIYDSEEMDLSSCAAVKSDSIFQMTAGILNLKSTGEGGKGLNVNERIAISGGQLNVLTTGDIYTHTDGETSSPRAIGSESDLTISGGTIRVISQASKGIISKSNLTIEDGTVEITSNDECLGVDYKDYALTIAGGSIYCYSADKHAVASNGELTICGGTLVATASKKNGMGLNCNNKSFSITGGTVMSTGNAGIAPSATKSTQPTIHFTGAIPATTAFGLTNEQGSVILSYSIPRSYETLNWLITSPSLSQGSSYSLISGGSFNSDNAFHGLALESNYTAGTDTLNINLSGIVTPVKANE